MTKAQALTISHDSLGHANETSIVDRFGHQGDDDQIDDGEDCIRYRQQVGHWSRETESPEGNLQIIRYGNGGKIECE